MRIAINGFGRIGRIFFRLAFNNSNIEIIAINDLTDIENLSYLLKYDTVYGRYDKDIKFERINAGNLQGKLIIDNKQVFVYSEKDPQNLPWRDLNIDLVIEATGVFTDYEKSKAHILAGAKRVVITAPPKDNLVFMFTPGIDIDVPKEALITSNASCTTNSVNPVIYIIQKRIGIKKASLTTIHAYTNTQALVDSISKGKDFRRGRAGALNIIPSTTGAAEATGKIIKEIEGKFDGISIRVPVLCGSLSDITILTERKTTVEEINNIFKEEAQKPEWQGILKVVEDQIVSSDIIGEPYGAIVDLTLTKVIDGDLVKIFSWYDNEYGYCAMLIKHIERLKI